jgi:hypothetical protein
MKRAKELQHEWAHPEQTFRRIVWASEQSAQPAAPDVLDRLRHGAGENDHERTESPM